MKPKAKLFLIWVIPRNLKVHTSTKKSSQNLCVKKYFVFIDLQHILKISFLVKKTGVAWDFIVYEAQIYFQLKNKSI